MSVSIHEHEAVVAERDALRRERLLTADAIETLSSAYKEQLSASLASEKQLLEQVDALRQQLAEAQTKNHWHKDNLSSIKFSLREIQREFDRRQISLMLTRCVEQVECYLADSEKLTALSALVEKSKECMALRQEVDARKANDGVQFSGLRGQIGRLNEQLAASQAREQKFRELLSNCIVPFTNAPMVKIAKWRVEEAFSIPTDTTAMQAYVARAGEVALKRAESMLRYQGASNHDLLRAIPAITMDDLKGGEA